MMMGMALDLRNLPIWLAELGLSIEGQTSRVTGVSPGEGMLKACSRPVGFPMMFGPFRRSVLIHSIHISISMRKSTPLLSGVMMRGMQGIGCSSHLNHSLHD